MIVIVEGGVVQMTFSVVDPESGEKIGVPIHAQMEIKHLTAEGFIEAFTGLQADKAALDLEHGDKPKRVHRKRLDAGGGQAPTLREEDLG